MQISKRFSKSLQISLITLMFGLFANGALAAAGDLDTSFGIGGKVTTAIGTNNDKAYSVIQQSDGKLVVAGSSNDGSKDNFALVRYNADGSLDTSFGNGGKVSMAIGISNSQAFSVIQQSDGKLVAAGASVDHEWAMYSTSSGGFYEFGVIALVRYNPDGTLDTSFGYGGIVTSRQSYLDYLSGMDHGSWASSVIQQSDGKLVVAGTSGFSWGGEFSVVRFNSNGTLDFAQSISISNDIDQAFAVVQQSDGKLVVAGAVDYGALPYFGLVRYNANGTLDSSFGSGGKVTTPETGFYPYGQVQSVIQQSDGKLAAAGGGYLVRYNTNGSLDTAFNSTGVVTTSIATMDAIKQVDDKFLLVGYNYNGSNYDFTLVRYNADGTLDTSFGSSGTVTTAIGAGNDYAQSVIQQSDGKLVVAGYARVGSYDKFAIARYESITDTDGDGVQDAQDCYPFDNTQSTCAAGTYPTGTGFALAPAGSYAINGVLTQCPAGTYNPNTGSSNISACVQTPAGSYSGIGSAAPTVCPVGNYQPSAGSASCIPASAGNFVLITGATAQTACAAGTYQPSTGQTSCITTPAGTYVPTTGATSSIQCAAGTYQPSAGSSSCIQASAGNFVSGAGATAQTACSVGFYQPGTGSTSCIISPAGSFVSTSGASSATQCVAGTYNSNTGSSSVSACVQTPAGSYSGIGSSAPTACAPGTYQPAAGSSSCISASTGFYVPTSGATSQIACPARFTSVSGSSGCFSVIKNDFNIDGKADVLLRNAAVGDWYLMQLNGLTVKKQGSVGAFTDPENIIVSTADFDGNGTADILTRGTVNGVLPGTFHIDLVSGQNLMGSAWLNTMSTDLNDVVMSTKDFNKDGKADVLLRNSVTGVWTINYMDGVNTPSTGTLNASSDLCYTMQGDGDYDGNGYPDILLRRDACGGATYPWLVQTLQGSFTVLASGVATGVTMNIGWAAMATDKDFNGDGKTDILMRDRGASPQLWLEYDMNGVGAPSSSGQLPIAVQSMWQLAADADFNGDGKADLLIRSVDTGQWFAYLMNDRAVLSSGTISLENNPIWSLQALDDNNGDGKTDILLHNNAGGAWYLYLMNGVSVSSKAILPLTYDLGYTLQND